MILIFVNFNFFN